MVHRWMGGLSLHYFGNNSGTAAALMGAIQLTIAGCMSALSTFIADGSLHPLVLTMGLCTIVCVFSVWSAYFLIRPNTN